MADEPKNSGDPEFGEMAEYIPTFIDETDEQLDGLVEMLLVLEREPDNVDELNEAFRLVHSIKGGAGLMGFTHITALTHHLENRFEEFRSGRQKLDKPTMNLVLRCTDFLRECIKRLREGQPLDTGAELLEELVALDDAGDEAKPETEREPSGQTDPEAGQDRDGAPSPESEPAAAAPTDADQGIGDLTDDGDRYHLAIEFEPGLPLPDLKARLILSRLSEMGEVASTSPPADKLETIESLTRFEVHFTTDQSAEAIRQAVDLDGVQAIELQGVEAEDVDAPPPPEPSLPAATEKTPIPAAEPAAAGPPAGPDRSRPMGVETMRVEIDRLDSLMNLAGELVVNRARFVQIAGQVAPAFRKRNVVSRSRDFGESLRRTLEHLQSMSSTNGELARDIDELTAGLALMEEQTALWDSGCRGFAQISEAIDQLTRISDSLQQEVLDTRMVPVGPLFNRFKRVVRDLSSQRGKKVMLQIRGEKTELDKRMVDELGDPLIHLVRNSIDHGLESPDVRLARGKPEAGTIELEASHSGNNVFIHVRDDGGGIDVARIKERAVDKELLSADEAEELSDEQAVEYIWHPGFSTAKELTDVSGRGVGMDAVKTRINELNGMIAVDSASGQGTTFTIRLPLTLAIINSLLIQIRQIIFSMPIEDVREIVSVPASNIVTVHGKHNIDVRGEYIPLITIHDVFEWNDISYGSATPEEDAAPDNGDLVHAVILQSGDKTLGLRVEELLGCQDIVIKSLSENFIQIRGLLGASILGDGTVCLMLDVSSVIDLTITKARNRDSAR